MQISSTHTGPSVTSSSVRKPVVGPAASAHVDARVAQKIASPVTPANTSVNTANTVDTSRMLVLARQNESIEGAGNNAPIGRLGNGAQAQRAVMEYNNVATQEQRFELTGVLVGIDVFA